MKIVLRSVLSACSLSPGLDGPELTRRRNITVRPGEGARTIIRDREPAGASTEPAVA